MFCPQCGKELNDGAAFCPYCGAQMPAAAQTQASAPASVPAPPVNQNPYGTYAAPQGVPESDIKTTKTLGLVALIVGIFVPLVSFICGGIGIGQVNRLKDRATPEQQERLAKNKKINIAAIIVRCALIVVNIVITIVSIFTFINYAKQTYDYFSDERNYPYSEDDARQFQENFEDYLKQYGIEVPKE